jgi:hypothetical protein
MNEQCSAQEYTTDVIGLLELSKKVSIRLFGSADLTLPVTLLDEFDRQIYYYKALLTKPGLEFSDLPRLDLDYKWIQ